MSEPIRAKEIGGMNSASQDTAAERSVVRMTVTSRGRLIQMSGKIFLESRTSRQRQHDIITFVPVGADNAMRASDIWKIANIWAESTFHKKLDALVDLGEIELTRQPRLHGHTNLYWRNS